MSGSAKAQKRGVRDYIGTASHFLTLETVQSDVVQFKLPVCTATAMRMNSSFATLRKE